ncbi:NAD-dependent succinate-semialdehyde dehydrogenase [Arthrobacter methylotrophus]|uniref:NAD-dependent succinate-semialdehyde dehydrogenase n=1 Tax=Arthrobacter methylotrophus TaxID=121291 RepID=A0ABV5UM57_9MICC
MTETISIQHTRTALYRVQNPATGIVVEEFPTASDADVTAALASAHGAYLAWREVPILERARLVSRVGELFAERAEELAAIITEEMGKLPQEARGELGLVTEIFDYYATEGPALAADQPIKAIGGGRAVIQKRPVGALLGIMPWNYPYYQVARFAAPNLVLGNTIILKHAPNCPRSALAMQRIFDDAGLPPGAYVNVFATNGQVADIIADPRVQGVSLTGSERAGAAVAEIAGRNLKKVVLELGGSDPLIVLDSADIAATARIAFRARMSNSGQACNSPKRMIVTGDIYDGFVAELTAQAAALCPGNPADAGTNFAPLASPAAAAQLLAQIQDAVDKGATLHTGGSYLDEAGSLVAPTILTGVTPGMRAYSEELFGPVAVVYRVDGDEEAGALANDSEYGLGAAVFSADIDRAQRIADRLDAGMVSINQPGGSSAELPFGGVKRSGVGRELGPLGMDEFVNKKLLYIAG